MYCAIDKDANDCRVEPSQLGRPLPDAIKAALTTTFVGAARLLLLLLSKHVALLQQAQPCDGGDEIAG